MAIGTFRPDQAPALHTLYCRATERLPHCRFGPSIGAFEEALRRSAVVGTELLVVERDGVARGLASVTALPAEAEIAGRVAITALLADDEAVGQELLQASLERARAHGMPIRAFPDLHNRCPIPAYNAGWCGLSDRLPMVARLLARAGFTPYCRELHLSLSDCRMAGPPTASPPGVTLEASASADSRGMRHWRALRNEVEVGICIASSVAHLSDDPAAARWGYVQGLGVDEAYRRQGIARWLMTTALADMANDGYAGCWLTTGAANWGAQRLYLSLGFEVVDSSTCFRYESTAGST
jgi:ribosomal protein S18 acetylase RimI-like enzyme